MRISHAASVFRVRALGSGTKTGTRVRLYLKRVHFRRIGDSQDIDERISCTSVVKDFLKVASSRLWYTKMA